jgi:benzodiazapine receptor
MSILNEVVKIRPMELSRLILCILICQAAGALGSVFTSSSVSTWYPTLIKPDLTPPGWVIGLVWIILFALIGISLFLVWREVAGRSDAKSALIIFAAQLVVNILWSWAFFGLRSPLSGLEVIAVLWILILLTIVKFWPISRVASLLLIPYILWVSFAAFLNFAIWRLN